MKKKLFVIDGHALCYRAYYAFIKNPLVNSKGQNTSAIYGFARMIYKLIEDHTPDYLAVAFDPPVKSFRFQLFEDYKATRQKTPDDLKPQIDEIKRMVDILGLPVIENPEYEADDILGSIAKQMVSSELDIVLVTSDKDAYQLLNPGIAILSPKKGISDYEVYGENEVYNKLGITSAQMIDYLALMGDSSDNIPGVKGIGEKSAQKLISQYGSLDEIYNNLNEITPPRIKQLLEDGKDSALLSRDLATIRCDVTIPFKLEDMTLKDIFSEKAYKFFIENEMPAIIRDCFAEQSLPVPEKQVVAKDYKIRAFIHLNASSSFSLYTSVSSLNLL